MTEFKMSTSEGNRKGVLFRISGRVAYENFVGINRGANYIPYHTDRCWHCIWPIECFDVRLFSSAGHRWPLVRNANSKKVSETDSVLAFCHRFVTVNNGPLECVAFNQQSAIHTWNKLECAELQLVYSAYILGEYVHMFPRKTGTVTGKIAENRDSHL